MQGSASPAVRRVGGENKLEKSVSLLSSDVHGVRLSIKTQTQVGKKMQLLYLLCSLWLAV